MGSEYARAGDFDAAQLFFGIASQHSQLEMTRSPVMAGSPPCSTVRRVRTASDSRTHHYNKSRRNPSGDAGPSRRTCHALPACTAIRFKKHRTPRYQSLPFASWTLISDFYSGARNHSGGTAIRSPSGGVTNNASTFPPPA